MARPIAVLFDLDGTLVDTIEFILSSVRHTFDGYRGRCPTDAEWIAGIGTPLRGQLADFALAPADVEPLLERYRAHQRLHFERMTRPYDGAVEVVRGLKERGHPLAVVTAKLQEPAERAVRLIGIADCMDAIVSADSCPRNKPHPDPVLLALSRLDRGPEEAVFIGDSPHDIAAGNAAGTASAAALWGACSREVLVAARPGHLLESIAEVPGLVVRLG
ncbi:MAG TPA: HAD-IA family hydrolase [Anaeromyxobacteraceae bacterium]|jgi:pyrophosphatase PpaX|nr:HAD-IA family hydrolase [Anaeromyxobacteraceae bacterium]